MSSPQHHHQSISIVLLPARVVPPAAQEQLENLESGAAIFAAERKENLRSITPNRVEDWIVTASAPVGGVPGSPLTGTDAGTQSSHFRSPGTDSSLSPVLVPRVEVVPAPGAENGDYILIEDHEEDMARKNSSGPGMNGAGDDSSLFNNVSKRRGLLLQASRGPIACFAFCVGVFATFAVSGTRTVRGWEESGGLGPLFPVGRPRPGVGHSSVSSPTPSRTHEVPLPPGCWSRTHARGAGSPFSACTNPDSML